MKENRKTRRNIIVFSCQLCGAEFVMDGDGRKKMQISRNMMEELSNNIESLNRMNHRNRHLTLQIYLIALSMLAEHGIEYYKGEGFTILLPLSEEILILSVKRECWMIDNYVGSGIPKIKPLTSMRLYEYIKSLDRRSRNNRCRYCCNHRIT